MNFGYRFLAILLIMFLTSCTKEVEKISVITENDIETQMIEFYKEGLEAL